MHLKSAFKLGAIFSSFLSLILLVTASHYARRHHEFITRYVLECPMRLDYLWLLIHTEADFQGQYPSNLVFVVEMFKPTTKALRHGWPPYICPGSKRRWGRNELLRGETDYIYVNWSRWFTNYCEVPPDFPLVYDRTLSNHHNQGIYLLKVGGEIIWDPGANWLKQFAEQHPEYALIVPQ